jgi:hypothetical protein
VYRRTLQHTLSAADRIKSNKITQELLARAGPQLAALQSTAAKAGQAVAKHIDAAVTNFEGGKKDTGTSAAGAAGAANTAAAAGVDAAVSKAAAAAAGEVSAVGSGTCGVVLESFDDAGEKAEAVAAVAAGDIVDAVLYAPGRLLYVKPVDEGVAEEQQRFELVDGRGGEPGGGGGQ